MSKRRKQTKLRRKPKELRPADMPVNSFTAAHGDYRRDTVVDLMGELGEGRNRMHSVLRNAAPTHVDAWFAKGSSGFEEPQRRAVDWVRSLWNRCGSDRCTTNWGTVSGGGSDDGAAESNALAELSLLKRKIPAKVWDAFENAARWDKLPEDEQSQAYAFALHSTGFTASMIAMWNGW